MTHLVAHTHNNIPVYVDLINSAAAKHIAEYPQLLTHAAEALRTRSLDGLSTSLEHNTGRSIGHDFIVKTAETDTIFYAQLVGDEQYTRFVKNGKPEPTQFITIVLTGDKTEGCYHLVNIWAGHYYPPLPGSGSSPVEDNSFWEEHARVFADQPIRTRTLTSICPY